jgi:hypothetical protein
MRPSLGFFLPISVVVMKTIFSTAAAAVALRFIEWHKGRQNG